MDVREKLNKGFLVFDGAMGTMLQSHGLQAGDLPELLNITDGAMITEIHRKYVAAGCDVVTTNTFGANFHKLCGSGYTVADIVAAAVQNAKNSGAPFVALDLGPTGQLLEPMGTLSFDGAYELFAEQVRAGAEAGADCIVIETLSDLYEAKAAVLAAKENSDLPVFCTLTFQEDRRTFTGTDPLTAVVALTGLGVDAVGVNCSLGPADLLPIVGEMLRYSRVPVMVQANAGLPKERDGQTVFNIGPEEYARHVGVMMDRGARIVGGCCGTTPAYTALLRRLADTKTAAETSPAMITAACSATRTRILDGRTTIIGERINPTGKKRLKEALRARQMDYIVGEAIDQTAAGSDVLDINVGLPELDEAEMLTAVIREVQGVTGLPLQIDSSDAAAIEAGVRIYNGKPIINSVNGKREVMEQIFPIVKKYGALIIGLTLDESGIPPTAEERFAIAEKILNTALSYGIPREDVLIDCLVLTASAQQEQVMETLKAIKLVKSRLNLKTVLGVSNVSFGLPNRPLLNSTFLAAALGAGLDAPIINPLSAEIMQVMDTFRVLNYEDRDAAHYIEKYANTAPAAPAVTDSGRTLYDCITEGRREEAEGKVKELLKTVPPLEIIDTQFIPALDEVGARFEKGRIFLPQLMQSAQAVKNAFEVIKNHCFSTGEKQESKGRIILATVQGDIHDIGKNIVKMMLENYGYEVIDLGKDVKIGRVVEAAVQYDVKLIGLSALMTTTVKNMQATITALKEAGVPCTTFVGGAVLNEEYAKMVGADYYAKDAQTSVKIAHHFFSGEEAM